MITSMVLVSSTVIKLFDLLLYTLLKYHFLTSDVQKGQKQSMQTFLSGIEATGLNCYVGNLLSLQIQ